MRIREITLYTSKISEQVAFFRDRLGFPMIQETSTKCSIQAGFTKVNFVKSEEDFVYHYAFLIPSDKLSKSIEWSKDKLNLIEIEDDRYIQFFESWNAESVYFYDGAGNLAEFIVRYDLKNEVEHSEFDITQILCLNEIGMPTNDIKKTNNDLESKLNSKFWKGDLERFGTNGSQDGLFLLVNNGIKKTWFPTELGTQSSPFSAIIELNEKLVSIEFINGKLSVNL